MKNEITIGVDKIGEEHPVYFIADIAANHDGNLERAKSLISLAKESGANAVKFQHHDVKKYVSDYGFNSFSVADWLAWIIYIFLIFLILYMRKVVIY